jgi:hypothetical protein
MDDGHGRPVSHLTLFVKSRTSIGCFRDTNPTLPL